MPPLTIYSGLGDCYYCTLLGLALSMEAALPWRYRLRAATVRITRLQASRHKTVSEAALTRCPSPKLHGLALASPIRYIQL